MPNDIATRELRQPVDIAEYLFRRLHQVGIRSVHGVPGKKLSGSGVLHRSMNTNLVGHIGDYNLVALDYLPKCGLKWVGNCNELNAGTLDLFTVLERECLTT